MNKKLSLILLLVGIVFIAGCGKNIEKRPITNVEVRKGTAGITMEFIKNAPPDKVFEEGRFPISLKLKNLGAFDIPKDNPATKEIESGLLIFGMEKAYLGLPGSNDGKLPNDEKLNDDLVLNDNNPYKNYFDIVGKSVFNPKGDEQFISVNGQAKKIGAQSETHPSTILATACYPYKTILDASVCIDTDILGQRRGLKPCIANDGVFSEGQGAPVTIKKIETRMLPQDGNKVKPHFIIHVKNAGNGEVISRSKIENVCSSQALKPQDFNKLTIKAVLSNAALDCSADGKSPGETEIRLKSKEDIVRCTMVKDIDANTDAYTAPLKIEIGYGYTFTISKNIKIEKVLTY